MQTVEQRLATFEFRAAHQAYMKALALDAGRDTTLRSIEAEILRALQFTTISDGMRDLLKRYLAFVRYYAMARDRFAQDIAEAAAQCGVQYYPPKEDTPVPDVPSPWSTTVEQDDMPF